MILLNITSIPYIPYSNLLVYIIIYITTSGSYHLLTYRAYMVYFDIKWNKSMEDSKWRLYIDPNETNWFLKNRNKWGSSKRILTICFLHWLLWFIAGCTSIIIGGPNTPSNQLSKMCIGAAGVTIITIDSILYLKMPSFNDIYYIHYETKLLLAYKVIFLVSFFIVTLILNAEPYTAKYIFLALAGIQSYFGFVMITYYIVLKKFNLPLSPYFAKHYTSTEFMELELSVSSRYNGKDSDNEKGKKHQQRDTETVYKLKLKEILETKHGFNCFARHLTKEFCLENLLFFVETQQLLDSLKIKERYKGCMDDMDTKSIRKLMSIKLPENAPKSRIVECDEEMVNIQIESDEKTDGNLCAMQETPKTLTPTSDSGHPMNGDDNTGNIKIYPSTSEYLQCIRLFRKYIANEATFCINIDAASRDKLYKQFGYNNQGEIDHYHEKDEHRVIMRLRDKSKIDVNGLFHIFDDCRAQIYQLMTFAYSRFRSTNEFQQLKEINKEINSINSSSASSQVAIHELS